MSDKQIISLFQSGSIIAQAEWRSALAKVSEIEDEKTKEITRTKSIVHQVEMIEFKSKTVMPFEIVEPKDEKFNCEEWNAKPKPYARGETVVLEIISFAWSEFKRRYRGKAIVHPLDTAKPKV